MSEQMARVRVFGEAPCQWMWRQGTSCKHPATLAICTLTSNTPALYTTLATPSFFFFFFFFVAFGLSVILWLHNFLTLVACYCVHCTDVLCLLHWVLGSRECLILVAMRPSNQPLLCPRFNWRTHWHSSYIMVCVCHFCLCFPSVRGIVI